MTPKSYFAWDNVHTASANWFLGGNLTGVALATAGVGTPEIAVGQAGDIISGVDTRAFGTKTIGTNTDLVFTISNSGTAALDLTGSPLVAISGNADFTIFAQPTTDPVPASGGSTTFTVRFNPQATGARSATVSIASDDSDENPFTFSVTGTGQTAYQAWATGSQPFGGDANGDGVQDGIAFLLGAATPGTNASALLPTVSESGGNLILTFNCLPVAARGGASLKVAHSTALASWIPTTNVVPDGTGADPAGDVSYVVDTVIATPLNMITATVDSAAAAGGKLFGRLQATE